MDKKRRRRILAAVLVLCIMAGMAAWPEGAQRVQAEELTYGDFAYEVLEDGTVSVTKYTGADAMVTVPDFIDGKSVTEIGEAAFRDCKNIVKITLPSALKRIKDGDKTSVQGAFSNCEGLTEMVIPDGVTDIGVHAFGNCLNLTKLTLPSELKYIGDSAFSCCFELTDIDIPNGVISIGEMAFSSCESLKRIILPESVTNIGRNAFQACTNLEEINIPDGITSIEIATFINCVNLKKISISSNVTDIKVNAFLKISGLKEVIYSGTQEQWKSISMASGNESLLKAVVYFNDGMISDASKGFLYEILLDDAVEIVQYTGTDSEINVTEQVAERYVVSIGDSAFSGCTGLTQISIPVSVMSISNNAFYGCDNLTDIYYGGTQEQWKQINIASNSGVEKDGITIHYTESSPAEDYKYYTLGDGTVSIKEYIGSDTVVNIPSELDGKRVTRIESHFFGNNENLIPIEVSIPPSVIAIDEQAFENCPNLTVIYVDDTSQSFASEDGVLFDKSKERLVKCPQKKSGAYVIPSSVTSIADMAFFGCAGLTEITLPAGVKGLEGYHFLECGNLTDIHADSASQNYVSENGVLFNKEKTKLIRYPQGKKDSHYQISDSVTDIGTCAFGMCVNLTEAEIPDGVDRIGNRAFYFCENLVRIQIPDGVKEIDDNVFYNCSSLREMEIPQGVQKICSGAFGECGNMKSISIPGSVTQIEMHAFSQANGPADWLLDVYYGGTKEQWEQIEVVDDSGSDMVMGNSVVEKLRLNAEIHFNNSPIVLPEEPVQPEVRNPKEELERLKSADPFSLEKDFSHYLTAEQMDILESYLFTWLAEVNYAYQYSGSSAVKELVMKKAGIDPQGDFASGMEQAITHVSVKTPFGTKTFEITMGLGKPDGSGNLYPGYGVMHYEVLEKGGIPSDVPVSGQIVRNYYTDMGPFVESVKKAAGDSLHGTYQWEKLEDAVTAGILVDKNVAEIVGNKNGSFSDGTFTIFAEPLFAYSKIVRIACPVDVHVYGMDGKEAGSIVNNQPSGGSRNVRLDVDGDTKTVYLAGDDYYLNLRGTGTGTMKYEVEEIANEDVQRTVQFLELQLKQDMQYEGYVFRPLNIDRDMYALRTKGSGGQEVICPDSDTYEASFKKVQQLSLSQKNTALESDRTVQLSASHLPLDASNPNLRWMTDNESVARVDENGLVTAVGSGRATVTVTTKDGSFLRQFCVIDVAGSDSDNDSDGNGGGNTGGSNGSTGGDGPGSGGGSGNTGGSGGTGGSAGGSGSGGSGTSGGTGQKPSIVKVHYVLQFDLNGGTKTSRKTMTLLSGDIPGIMPKAQRKDYTFSGWYTKQQGGEKINGDKPLDAAATLYARWAKAAAPAKPASLKLASKKKGQIQAGFQKVNGAAGYQIEYSENKNFTSAKIIEAKASAKSKAITGLKARKKYYVRVRAYSLDSMNNRVYGVYGTVKSVKVKA